MSSILLLFGIAAAIFVGINIGGSSTGVAFGPAVGSGAITKLGAATLMTVFAFVGGMTWGRNVIQTIGVEIIPESVYSLKATVGILMFVGLGLLVSNLFGVPASTSMTTVGAVAGLGLATKSLHWDVLGQIVVWWLIAPIIAFWVCAVIGRYLYARLAVQFTVTRSEGPLIDVRRQGRLPRMSIGRGTTKQELLSNALVIIVACYMAFSAGASNVANAVAPLVGNGVVEMNAGILLASFAIGLGSFSIARRTLNTVGNDLTDLPILAALIVEVVSATLITFLARIGIPASLAVSTTMCIVGLGWGRATRAVTLSDVAVDAFETNARSNWSSLVPTPSDSETKANSTAEISQVDSTATPVEELFDPSATARVLVLWMLTPSFAALSSFLLFEYVAGL